MLTSSTALRKLNGRFVSSNSLIFTDDIKLDPPSILQTMLRTGGILEASDELAEASPSRYSD
jgi:hypothetical protein